MNWAQVILLVVIFLAYGGVIAALIWKGLP